MAFASVRTWVERWGGLRLFEKFSRDLSFSRSL